MKSLKKFLIAAAIAALSLSANATLQTSAWALVTNVRVEGIYGNIVLTTSPLNCGTTSWFDITTADGKAIYATAMTSIALGRNIQIRVYDDAGLKVNGFCKLYDIYM